MKDLHVVVTGGTGALGSAVVGALIERGATCHVPVVAPRELERFALASHARVRVTQGVDLTDESDVGGFYAGVPDLWASIHLAGGFAMSPLARTSRADFMKQLEMNALTCFMCCREAVKRMRARKSGSEQGGRIVNVAARPALAPEQGAGMAAYTASKAAVAALTCALGTELAPESILVNAVAPSIMDTPANRASMPDADFAPWPKVEQVASVILFLASPENRLTRGAVVNVYGRS